MAKSLAFARSTRMESFLGASLRNESSDMASTLKQKIRNVGRLTQIVNIFARYGFRKELQKTELGELVSVDAPSSSEGSGGTPEGREELSRAQRLVLAFEELGPTFVKLGQLLASREDLLPRQAIMELRRLQDSAKPFPPETLERILTQEFKGKYEEIFSSVEPVPLGAASIGQVHRATLTDGRAVVLKVQRPEVDHLIRTDLSILMGVASILERAFPELRQLKPTAVIAELQKSLEAELDFFREASNTERMRSFFQEHPKIYIPEIYREYSTRTVLCMEAIAGTKLTQLATEENIGSNQELVAVGVRAFLDMTFKFGVFHADLHPGNFLLMKSGRLAILDFGLTARLTREMRNTMSLMFLALVNEDLETFARLFSDLTEVGPEFDRLALEQEIRSAVDAVLYTSLADLQIGKLLMQIARIAASKNAPVSRELIFFFRALIALESFGRSLNPDFQVLKEASDYAQGFAKVALNRDWMMQESVLFLRDSQYFLRELPLTMRVLARRAQAGSLTFHIRSEEIGLLARELDRAANRLSLALLLGALILGSSILTYGKQGQLYDSLATLGLIGFGIAGFLGIWLVVGILRSGRFR